jgi:hypothetical protein
MGYLAKKTEAYASDAFPRGSRLTNVHLDGEMTGVEFAKYPREQYPWSRS